MFQHEKRSLGLVGDTFRMFTQLALRIQAVEGLSDTTSPKFIQDAAFEWLEGKYKNTITESCSDYILKKADQEIKDFEIWIPVYRTYLESPISMGPVVFRTITREMLDRWHRSPPELDAESMAAARFAFARERSTLQGYIAVTTKIQAERNKAVAIAREQAERAVALLRFFSPANWTPKIRSYCTLLGSENVRLKAELFTQGNSIVTYNRGVLDEGAGSSWKLPTAYLTQFRGVLGHLTMLSGASGKTPFQQNLYDALLIYSRNSVAIDPADKLIYILVALESMLLRNENEPLGKNIGERLAFVIGNSLENRKKVLANAVEIYRLRSAFIHHGHSIQDIEVLQTFMLNVLTCFISFLGVSTALRPRTSLLRRLRIERWLEARILFLKTYSKQARVKGRIYQSILVEDLKAGHEFCVTWVPNFSGLRANAVTRRRSFLGKRSPIRAN